MKIKISYQTLILPPPFAFGYTLDLETGENEVQVNFEMEYLNRDTLTEEEIAVEGFTLDDNFVWKGTLNEAWLNHLTKEINTLELENNSSDENIWMHFKITGESGERSGHAADIELWDFQIQEVIQAIYEKTNRELPLKVTFLTRTPDKSIEHAVIGLFETRTAKVNETEISWESMQELMKLVFSIEFTEEPTVEPKQNGLWVDLEGEGEYFKIRKQSDINAIKAVIETAS